MQTSIGTVPIGNAAAGLCGGMCFTAHDFLYATGTHHPQTPPHRPPDPPITYLTRRLLDSWRIPDGVMTYYWDHPDHDTALGLRHGLAPIPFS